VQRPRLSGRREAGQASAELLGMLWWMLLAALVVWQLLLAAWTTVSASNAARTGSRVESRGGGAREAEEAAVSALSSPLRRHAQARANGETVRVRVRIPVIVPGLSVDDLTVTKSATFPRTD
jgi:hypothetical protein